MVLRVQQNRWFARFAPRPGSRCPPRVRQERGFEPWTAFNTTVTSVRRHSGLSISREPFDFRRAQRREGISAAQRSEALVPSESGDQGAAADDELRVDRDRVGLRYALLPPEAQQVRFAMLTRSATRNAYK